MTGASKASASEAGALWTGLLAQADGEPLVREALTRLEAAFRRLALLCLADWHALNIPQPALFEAVASLQRPSWGSYNGLIEALRKASRRAARDGSESERTRLAEARALADRLAWLDSRCPADLSAALQPLCSLCGSSKRLRMRAALALPIGLRNIINHDQPSAPSWWQQAAAALRPLLAFLAREQPFLALHTAPSRPPWMFADAGGLWVFNGLRHDFVGRYLVETADGVEPQSSAERGAQVLLAFEGLLGRTATRDRSLKALLGRLAPEDIKGVMLADFLVGAPAGEGGFATVHKGVQLSTGRPVAVKILRDGMDTGVQDRFHQEAQLLSRFNHPHIVQVLASGEAAWRPPAALSLKHEPWYALFSKSAPVKHFIALEWIAGRTLEQVFAEAEQPPLDQRVAWFLQAARALASVHGVGLIHRDVKPANLMLNEHGQLKLMDFGIARSLDEGRTIVTRTGQVFGTEAYMSPEQLRAANAEIEVGPASDLYSLCASFYELFARRRLFGHGTSSVAEVRTRKLSGQLPAHPRALVSDLPWEIGTILMGGLEPEPGDRYRSMTALQHDLEAYLARKPITYKRPSWLRRLWLAYRRNQRVWRVTALAALVVVAVSIAFLQRAHANQQDLISLRRGELRTLEQRLEAQESAKLAAHTDALLERYGEQRKQGRLLIDGQQRAANTERVLELLELAGCAQTLLRRAREPVAGQQVALLQLHQVHAWRERLVEHQQRAFTLALHNESYALAELVLEAMPEDLLSLEQHRAQLQTERQALLLWQQQTTRAALEDLRLGRDRPGRDSWAPTPDDYLIELSGFRSAEALAVLQEALLPYRERAAAESRRGQPRTYSQAEREELELILRCLGHIDLPELALPGLAAFMAVVWDHRLAVTCGEALCNTRLPAADSVLVAARERLGASSDAWHQIARVFRRIPLPDVEMPLVSADAYLRRGRLRKDKGDPAGAIVDFSRALALAPDDPRPWDERGALRLARETYPQALEDFSQALALDPGMASAWSGQAAALQALGRPDEALRSYGQALQADPDDALIWSNRGVLLARLGRVREAVADYSRSLELDPLSGYCWSNRGCAWLDLAETELALDDFDRAIELDPGFAPAWHNRANTWMARNDPEQALPDFDRALALQPGDARILRDRAQAHLSLGNWQVGFRDLDKAIELAPRDPEFVYLRGNAHYFQEDLEQAIIDYDRAEALGFQQAALYLARASCRLRLGRASQALPDMQAALRLAPAKPLNYVMRARVFWQLGRTEEALEDYGQALQLDAQDPATFIERGDLHAQLGQHQAYYEDYLRARALRPRNLHVLYSLACLTAHFGSASSEAHTRQAWLQESLEYLGEAVDFGWKEAERTAREEALQVLHELPAFAELLERMR